MVQLNSLGFEERAKNPASSFYELSRTSCPKEDDNNKAKADKWFSGRLFRCSSESLFKPSLAPKSEFFESLDFSSLQGLLHLKSAP